MPKLGSHLAESCRKSVCSGAANDVWVMLCAAERIWLEGLARTAPGTWPPLGPGTSIVAEEP